MSAAEDGAPTGATSSGMRAAVLALLGAALSVLVVAEVAGAGRAALEPVIDGGLYDGLLAGCAVACWLRAATAAEGRAAWAVTGLAVAAWAGGSIHWDIAYALGDAPDGPSLADALWLAFYPLAACALVLHARPRLSRPSRWLVADALLGVGAVTSIFGGLVVLPIVRSGDSGLPPLELAVNGAYPIADLALLAGVAAVFGLAGNRTDRDLLLFGAGLAVLCLGDSAYLLAVVHDTYEVGGPLDAVWPLGLVLLAAAALVRPHSAAARPRRSRTSLLVPSASMLLVLGMLVVGNFTGLPEDAALIGVCTMLAAVVRLAASYREILAIAHAPRVADTDELTGLPNRRMALRVLRERLAHARRSGSTVGLLVLDLDRFKELNDALGHHAGDELLRDIARRIESVLRRGESVGRLGGDEFALIVTPAAAAPGLAQRVHDAVCTPLVAHGVNVRVTPSIGIACYPEHAADGGDLLQHADTAMYRAKRAGLGWSTYEAAKDESTRDRLVLLAELREAIPAGDLVLMYQPKVRVSTGEVVGAEVLVRWQHPERGLLGPDEFIGLAENGGLIRDITLHVVQRALAQCREWLDRGIVLPVSVNASVVDLVDDAFRKDLVDVLRRTAVPHGMLGIEITETTLMSDVDRVSKTVLELTRHGIGIALDDFGTGYSSLALLRALAVDELKIDRSFIRDLPHSSEDVVIVRAIVDLARNLGMRVVAEGVESGEALACLRGLGCDHAQGHHYSRPVRAGQLEKWLHVHGGMLAAATTTVGTAPASGGQAATPGPAVVTPLPTGRAARRSRASSASG